MENSESSFVDIWDYGFLETAEEDDRQKVICSTSGKVTYDAEVYWIPTDTDAYQEIDEWKSTAVWEAWGLRSSEKINAALSGYDRFERHRAWDFKKILEEAYS